MKALVLAAGLGTRLLPHTRHTPKPLFTVGGRPLLDIAIRRLVEAGAEAIVVNTHHLHERIEAFLDTGDYPVPVTHRHEPDILGTGGAIRNLSDFWDDRPFWVVNSDIYTDIDLRAVADFHRSHSHPATLALVDDPRFNTVRVDARRRIVGFDPPDPRDGAPPPAERLTFTGIQVLDPEILAFLPPAGPASSIDAFRSMIDSGRTLAAWVAAGARWTDLGTPDRYLETAREVMAAAHTARTGGGGPGDRPSWTRIAGDGSDRRWWRVSASGGSWVMADHGIRTGPPPAEVDAFVSIGRHLAARGVPVPEILAADTFAGLVMVEDFGDTPLAERVAGVRDREAVARIYREVLELLIHMSVEGARGFDPSWTYQTPAYDRETIVERECRYFLEAYVHGWMGLRETDDALERDFQALADRILAPGLTGFLHRDFQSRNIMVTPRGYGVIDFQGGRLGPVTYDAASLLIDPYVNLEDDLIEALRDGFAGRYASVSPHSAGEIRRHFHLCSLARNLQILGAFAFLTRVKKKPGFAAHIPAALRRLRRHPLLTGPEPPFPALGRLVQRLPRP
jgi:aminoglycoside/choline kinase family phosphotransferase/dTDP-glucose pyrophosphorylase